MSKVHHRQLFTNLKLKDFKPGYLLNFGASLMKDGIKRMINGLEDESLWVFGSLREAKKNCQPDGDLNSESLRSSP
jgi:plasmid rolling circle replication initiator protein Rep